jgi:hypothetical protein
MKKMLAVFGPLLLEHHWVEGPYPFMLWTAGDSTSLFVVVSSAGLDTCMNRERLTERE